MSRRYLNPRQTETAGSPVLPCEDVPDTFTSSDRAMVKPFRTSSCLRLRQIGTDERLIGAGAGT